MGFLISEVSAESNSAISEHPNSIVISRENIDNTIEKNTLYSLVPQ